MSSRIFVLLVIGAACLLATKESLAENPNNQLIGKFTEEYAQAFMAEDVEAIMGLVTDDFVLLIPDKPPFKGKVQVRKEIERDFETMQVEHLEFSHAEIESTSLLAYTWGTSIAKIQLDGEEIIIREKYLWVMRRDFDGSWKLARKSTNRIGPSKASSE